MDIFAFSDIHGHKELFDKIYTWLNGRSTPWKCCFLGDACGYGTFGYEIIKALLNDSRFVYLKGDHEQMFASAAMVLKTEWLKHKVAAKDLFNNSKQYIWDYLYLPEVALCVDNEGFAALFNWIKDGAPMDIIHSLLELPENVVLSQEICGFISLSHTGNNERTNNCIIIHGHTPIGELKEDSSFNFSNNDIRPAFYHKGKRIDLDTKCYTTNTITVLNLNTFEQHRFTTLI